MKKVLIIGGNGHGSIVTSCIRDNKNYDPNYDVDVAGFLNDFETHIDQYPVLGGLDDVERFVEQGYYFVWAIHLIGKNKQTKALFEKIHIPQERLLTVIHHSAFISEYVTLAPGCLVMPHAFIGARTHLGLCTMVKANACIAHDVECGSLCCFALNSTTGAYSKIGICSDVATGSVVLEHVKIGDCAMLGAASLATHNIPNGEIHVGSPAKFLKLTM